MKDRTILLVDAHEDSLEVYATMLRHVGYNVLLARSADEALLLAVSGRPHVIVLELLQRTDSGWLTPQRLKENPRTREIPILAVTAHALDSDREQALNSGCDHFLTKPLHPTALASLLEAFLDPLEPVPPT
jgi:two-component system, cell cycle response regulator DivK